VNVFVFDDSEEKIRGYVYW